MGVLGHLSALVSVQEDVINVEGCSNKGLLVSRGDGGSGGGGKVGDGPEALTNGSQVKVDLDLVVLESNEGEGKAGGAAKPELKGDVQGGLRESIAGSTNLTGPTGSGARTRDVGEGGVGDVGKLGGVTNHLEVSALLLRREGHLVPDVHPVTVLTVDSLATNFNLNDGNQLLTNKVEPSSIDSRTSSSVLQGLVDLRKSHLKVGAVSKITISADGAGHSAAEIGLAREGLLNALHGVVSMSAV